MSDLRIHSRDELIPTESAVLASLAAALEEHDLAMRFCPMNGPRPPRASEACKECGSKAAGPCWKAVRADAALAMAVRRHVAQATTPAQPERGGDEAEGGVKPKAPDAAEVVVPREPTEAMISAVPVTARTRGNWRDDARDAYRAMISTAEQEGEGVMGRLLCLLGFHDFRRSRFVALNSRVADFRCTRCWKWRSGDPS